ncbi:MAG: multicopper oxidase domain-containing protein, partial [Rhodanobacteraceae bacterium]
MDRRNFLKTASLSALAAGTFSGAQALAASTAVPGKATLSASKPITGQADYTLRIATGVLELAPERFVSTTLYNGDFPGPLLRFRQGKQTTIDIFNDTDHDEQVHWHGQFLPDNVDGAFE